MIHILKRYFAGLIVIAAVIMIFSSCTGRNAENSIEENNNDFISGDDFSRYLPPELTEKYPRLTNLPALYITLDSPGSDIDKPVSAVKKDTYVSGRYTLVYDGWEGRYDEAVMVKGRGNYSWSLPKKPYTLKLVSKRAMLGMESAKKWILLANYSDKTLLRNYLTLKLALDVSRDYSPDCRFVDLYLNGKYNGNYLIVEAIQIHKNRLDIDAETEALFEIEAAYRHDDHTDCIIVPSGLHIMYKKPDEEDISTEIRNENFQNFKQFLNELDISLGKGYGEYSQYIDVDSFIDWYIVNEFVKNYDSAFTSSCYCFIKDGKLHMGPVWDYDTCYGNQEIATCINPEGYHVNGSPWYSKLTSDDDFNKLLRIRWKQLRNEQVFDTLLLRLLEGVDYIAESEKKDHELWRDALKSKGLRGSKSKYTFEEEIDYLIDWIIARMEWLDGEWG